MGSWKIIEILRPRSERIVRSGSFSKSCPSKRTSPESILPGAGTRRMIDSDVTVLPDPDSPTTATVVALGTSKETPSTALKAPAPVGNDVTRLRMESSVDKASRRCLAHG